MQARERVGCAGFLQPAIDFLQLAVALGQLTRTRGDLALETPAVLDLPCAPPRLDADPAEEPGARQRRIARVRPRRAPRRGHHAHAQLQPLLVPDAVVVRGTNAERVGARRDIRVRRSADRSRVDPVAVESLEPVRVAVLLGCGEVERRELEGEQVVAPADLDLVDLRQRPRERDRPVELAHRREDDGRHVGVPAQQVGEERHEAVRAAEEHLAVRGRDRRRRS